MKSATQTAPAKLILLGEHAVVYGQPAIAVPLKQLCAEATLTPAPAGEPISVILEDFENSGDMTRFPAVWKSGSCPPNSGGCSGFGIVSPEFAPFARLLELATADGEVPDRGWRLQVRSRIPIGCGLGSSAAVCAASFRAIHSAFDVACTPEQLALALYETERIMHGTPSGIDNTVIALERPVLFQNSGDMTRFPAVWKSGSCPRNSLRLLQVPAAEAFLVVGYSGIRHKTREVVGDVRKAWTADRAAYDALFEEIGQATRDGAQAFEAADWRTLGALMDRNQTLLERMGVSCGELETLLLAARQAGALGAKLSGAGRGGCMVALAEDAAQAQRVQAAMEQAGATMCITSSIARHEIADERR